MSAHDAEQAALASRYLDEALEKAADSGFAGLDERFREAERLLGIERRLTAAAAAADWWTPHIQSHLRLLDAIELALLNVPSRKRSYTAEQACRLLQTGTEEQP